MYLRYVTLVLVLSLCAVPRAAAAGVARSDTTESQDNGVAGKLLKPKFSRWGLVWVPRVYYSSETSLGLGAHVLRPFRLGAGTPGSSVRAKGRVAFKGQSSGELRLKILWGAGAYVFNTKFKMTTIPERFFGIGTDAAESDEEVYRPQDALYYVEVFRGIGPSFRFGLRAEVENHRLIENEPDGQLSTDDIPGTGPSTVVGGGVLFEWDTRDRSYSPRGGSYHQAFLLVFDDEFGTDREFIVYNVDLRKYVDLGKERVLAGRAFLYGADGNTPFWRLAALGGREHSRGYRRGRYLDNVLIVSQLEVRAPLRGRLGAAVFAGAAVVGERPDRVKAKHVRPCAGIGLRYRLGSHDGVRARADLAFGVGSVRAYFTLDEAF